MPEFPYVLTDNDVTFTVTAPEAGYYDITVSGPQVKNVMPGGGNYTMNINGPRGRVLDTADLNTEIRDRWNIVMRETTAALNSPQH